MLLSWSLGVLSAAPWAPGLWTKASFDSGGSEGRPGTCSQSRHLRAIMLPQVLAVTVAHEVPEFILLFLILALRAQRFPQLEEEAVLLPSQAAPLLPSLPCHSSALRLTTPRTFQVSVRATSPRARLPSH